MKIGDVVTDKKGRVGMIVYRKGNFDIGVNFKAYHLSLLQKPELSNLDRSKYLRHFGVDQMFTKSELE